MKNVSVGGSPRRRADCSRMGVTMIELIIVIAIVGLLASLILPAVQSMRATARQFQCQNNLKQIVLALHNYHDQHSVLPPWGVFDGACGPEGAFTLLFPFLENPRFCDAMSAGVKRIPLFECPADGDLRSFESPLSYRLNHGPGRNAGSAAKGPFSTYRGIYRLSDVTDGTSQTAALSENVTFRAFPNESMAERHRIRSWWYVTYTPVSVATLFDPFTPSALAERSAQTELSISNCENGPRTWAGSGAGYVSWQQPNTQATTYSHWLNPNRRNCSVGGLLTAIPMDIPFLSDNRGANSDHFGGVNIGYLDGHIRFINQSIDKNVWRAIGTMNGGESTTNIE